MILQFKNFHLVCRYIGTEQLRRDTSIERSTKGKLYADFGIQLYSTYSMCDVITTQAIVAKREPILAMTAH